MESEAITFVLLTCNEGYRLHRALASIPPGAHIFVLDAESTDDTTAVAARFGAQVESRAWTTFAQARRYALARVTTPWVCMLDADEIISTELASAIHAASGNAAGYAFLRENRFCGRIMRGGAWANERVLRLVQRSLARIEASGAGYIHERLIVDGEVAFLTGSLDHDSYPSIASYWRKFHRYTAIEASGGSARLIDIVTAIPVAFARAIFQLACRAGYRDGWRGYFIAFANAAYPVVVRYKAWLHHHPKH